jgi:hypothetical protein
MPASDWTNKNVTRIVRKDTGSSQTWFPLHTGAQFAAGSSIECTEIEFQVVEGVEFWIAIDGGPGTDNIEDDQYWVIPAKSTSTGHQTFRVTGITNTSQVSARANSGNQKLQYITRFYSGHVQTG